MEQSEQDELLGPGMVIMRKTFADMAERTIVRLLNAPKLASNELRAEWAQDEILNLLACVEGMLSIPVEVHARLREAVTKVNEGEGATWR